MTDVGVYLAVKAACAVAIWLAPVAAGAAIAVRGDR